MKKNTMRFVDFHCNLERRHRNVRRNAQRYFLKGAATAVAGCSLLITRMTGATIPLNGDNGYILTWVASTTGSWRTAANWNPDFSPKPFQPSYCDSAYFNIVANVNLSGPSGCDELRVRKQVVINTGGSAFSCNYFTSTSNSATVTFTGGGLVTLGTYPGGQSFLEDGTSIIFADTETLSGYIVAGAGESSAQLPLTFTAGTDPGAITTLATGGVLYNAETEGVPTIINGLQLINDGTITANNPGYGLPDVIIVEPNLFTNSGIVETGNAGIITISPPIWNNAAGGIIASNSGGGVLTLSGTWTNLGTITGTDSTSTINLGGSFTTAGLGTFTPMGSVVNLTGAMDNSNNVLTFNSSTGGWNIAATGTITGGTINIAGGGSLNALGSFNISNGTTFNVSGGTLQSVGTLNVLTGGALQLSSGLITVGALSLQSGLPGFQWTGGTLQITGSGSSFGGTLTVPAGGTLKLDGAVTDSVAISPGGVVALDANAGNGILVRTINNITFVGRSSAPYAELDALSAANHSSRQLVMTSTLSLPGATNAWQGKIDLANNDMDVQGASLAVITNQVKEGYSNGSWAGLGGITSTSAAGDTSHLTAIGVILNGTTYGTATGSLGTFDTINPATGDILLKYTYYGDANLDGVVDGSDYALIDSGYGRHLTGWQNGDFNYDGVVDGSDYSLIDNVFNNQTANLSTSALVASATAEPAAVPEPTAMAISCACLIGMSSARAKRARLKRT